MPIHHTLKAWQHAQRLAVACAQAANRFPHHEQAALAVELRRAAYRIPLKVACGAGRTGTHDARKLFDAAWGALAEVQSALALARDIGYLEPAEFGRLEALATETSKTLFGLLRKTGAPAGRPNPR